MNPARGDERSIAFVEVDFGYVVVAEVAQPCLILLVGQTLVLVLLQIAIFGRNEEGGLCTLEDVVIDG